MVNEGRASTITEQGSKLVVGAFDFGDGAHCAGGEFDLNDFEGQCFRLYMEQDGSLCTDANVGHYWQLAEADVPIRHTVMVETDQLDADGIPILESQKQPLDVSADVQVSVWALPE